MEGDCYVSCRELATSCGQSVTEFVTIRGPISWASTPNSIRSSIAKGTGWALAFGGHVKDVAIWQLRLYGRQCRRCPTGHL